MASTTDEDLEEMVDLQIRRALERELPPPEPEKPSELVVLTEEIRNFASKVSEAVARPPEVVVSPPVVTAPSQPSELTDLLTQMVQVNRTVALALSKPATAFPVSPPQLAPVVHVSPPTVNLSPQVTVERPSKWRFIVTKRDPNAQFRIQEITAEIIE